MAERDRAIAAAQRAGEHRQPVVELAPQQRLEPASRQIVVPSWPKTSHSRPASSNGRSSSPAWRRTGTSRPLAARGRTRPDGQA
jgi:hypothetical protein